MTIAALMSGESGTSSLKDRVSLITGSTSGIGLGIARALAGAGSDVVLNGFGKPEEIEAARESVAKDYGVRVDYSGADMSKPDSIAEMIETTLRQFRRLDILVNNAGIQRISPIEDFDPADFRRLITLMLEAPFLLIRAALPHMYANNFGRIINLSSVHGLRASPFKSAYVSAKHGLEGLSKVTALEGGAHGVTSNCINPGYVRTPLVESQIADQAKVHGIPESEVLTKIMLTEAAVKRLVEPEEVASLVAWLASDHAGMVTGASYTMDGGWSAR